MAVSINKYGKCYANLLGGEAGGDTFAVDFITDTIKASLHASTYTPNLDTHEIFSDVTNEITGTGYTAGGVTLASKTIVYTPAASGTAWVVATVYAVGDIVRKVSTNGHLYRCIVAGTSHASTEPTWPTVSGQTIVDNTVTWAEIGRGMTQIDAADPSWAAATLTGIRYMAIYKSGGGNPLLWLVDFGADQAVTAGTFTAVLHALGLEVFATP